MQLEAGTYSIVKARRSAIELKAGRGLEALKAVRSLVKICYRIESFKEPRGDCKGSHTARRSAIELKEV